MRLFSGGCGVLAFRILLHHSPKNHCYMPNYAMSNHSISYNAAFDVLSVTNTDNNAVVTYDLTTAHELKVQESNYVISSSSVPTGWHQKKFKPSENDTLSVQQTDHLGVSDLRVERRRHEFYYHLDKCPVRLKYDADGLLVFSPCEGGCTAPSAACCTISETSY